MTAITVISDAGRLLQRTEASKTKTHKRTVPPLDPNLFQAKRNYLDGKRVLAQSKASKQPMTVTQNFQKVFPKKDEDSDDDTLVDFGKLVIFDRRLEIPPIAMTVVCKGDNIKGSKLIEIVHEVVNDRYCEAIDLACEYEKETDGPVISKPREKNGILFIDASKDWFLSLGGWKGMAPAGEVRQYFFYNDSENEDDKFKGVQIFNNGLQYILKSHRIHLPKGFSIKGIDITKIGRQTARTDLAYPQIVAAIEVVKQQFNIDDAKVALLQLFALTRCIHRNRQITWFYKLPKENQQEMMQFLDFLNGLMFGVEPSGLNAAIATSLMTLDLIVDGRFSYQQAFQANGDGGIYPYACFGNNQGTYRKREEIIVHGKRNTRPLSMKDFRKKDSPSPVGAKEAMIIKDWLKFNAVIVDDKSCEVNLIKISSSIRELMDFYFAPWLEKKYTVEKFQKYSY